MKKYSLRTVLIVGLCALGLSFGINALLPSSVIKSNCHHDLVFVSEVARCDGSLVINKAAYSFLRNDIVDVIERRKKEGKITRVSVFFRDLHNAGPTFGIDANADFSPASLLKIPMALTYLRLSEEQYPDLLDVKIESFREEEELKFIQNFVPLKGAEYGKKYSVRELINLSLRYSDNVSYTTLYYYLLNKIPQGEEELIQTFKELGVLDFEGGAENFISVREYAALFRQLYSASYLSPALSNFTLSRLGGLDVGIRGAVPPEVTVASKFGERGFEDGIKQLHDCGIIYYPDNPYILCIMTEGMRWDHLSEMVREITQMVYREVDSRRIEK